MKTSTMSGEGAHLQRTTPGLTIRTTQNVMVG